MKKMKKTGSRDILRLFKYFQTNVLEKQPLFEKMLQDVRMMQYKIRPLQGDISIINFSNKTLVETLWKLGKMEDFIATNSKVIKKDQEQTFFQYFDGLYGQLQERLNNLQLVEKRTSQSSRGILEMEIFKERLLKKRIN